MVGDLWETNKMTNLSGLEPLIYRSHLLGSDRSIANWGGGNTSMKTKEMNFRGQEIDVMWVKGSGSDLASMGEEHFTGLKLDDISPLLNQQKMTDEKMVDYLSHCMIDNKHPRSSIETLLHAFLPFTHIDHTHPDAIISICCADNGKQIARDIYGNRFVWVPYVRPGFQLSKMIAEAVKDNPNAELVLMEKHGLVTWGNTSESCYHQTLSVIQKAEDYINRHLNKENSFGESKYNTLLHEDRRSLLEKILPIIRGEVSIENKMIVTYDDGENVLDFVNSSSAPAISQVGAACPDHLVHTKRVPLYIDWNPQKENVEQLKDKVVHGIDSYKERYKQYFRENQNEGDQMADPAPRVLLIPGIGMVNTGKDWSAAQVSGSLYHRAIAVMKGSMALGQFVSLNEKESYDIEYWPLELYKLSLAPREQEFSRHVGFITGGAGGIGSATCRKMVDQGMHVAIADLDEENAQNIAQAINSEFGANRAIALKMDVTREKDVKEAMDKTILTYGGIDVLVNNAGLASSSPLDETTLQKWQLNIDVLTTGYFLVARETLKVMKSQNIGGNMVFVGSKNSIYASKNSSAYSTAKAAETHLARCIAAEVGEYDIRVNSVLPDAVLQGSKIWNSSWREERAATYGIQPDELDEHYRKRTTLQVNVFPEDIAEAIAYFASSKSAKTTGCILTVDGGVPAAFTR